MADAEFRPIPSGRGRSVSARAALALRVRVWFTRAKLDQHIATGRAWHSIEVVVKSKNLKVRAREGYYPE